MIYMYIEGSLVKHCIVLYTSHGTVYIELLWHLLFLFVCFLGEGGLLWLPNLSDHKVCKPC